ncbi:hypothetical protein SEA_SIXAMA_123 [Gordonia phage Sixama]|uniref:Uncharacterized protein n=1 Tax=Gordonia phage Sixama TaxID=2653271 RepID=A0A5Q2F0M5_9CAUD|nr:hypothetical protein PP302_gp123 [Gordonia phage Sixama]QGF20302.1 hypothetical protein SEA_SIXAMA_123 [Gordonia phage Sixama]
MFLAESDDGLTDIIGRIETWPQAIVAVVIVIAIAVSFIAFFKYFFEGMK